MERNEIIDFLKACVLNSKSIQGVMNRDDLIDDHVLRDLLDCELKTQIQKIQGYLLELMTTHNHKDLKILKERVYNIITNV